eukprot:1344613-Rhodomonas_salina.2
MGALVPGSAVHVQVPVRLQRECDPATRHGVRASPQGDQVPAGPQHQGPTERATCVSAMPVLTQRMAVCYGIREVRSKILFLGSAANDVLAWDVLYQVSKLSRQLYGMSIFFCWLRLLHLYRRYAMPGAEGGYGATSVNRTLGLLVLVLRRIAYGATRTDDIITFVFIWVAPSLSSYALPAQLFSY